MQAGVSGPVLNYVGARPAVLATMAMLGLLSLLVGCSQSIGAYYVRYLIIERY